MLEVRQRRAEDQAHDPCRAGENVFEREHASPGRAEEMDPLEPELRANCVDLFAEDGDRPLDVPRAIGAPATDLVVDDDRALGTQPLERAEVVVRRARAAVQGEERYRRRRQIADNSVPGAAAAIVDVALRNRRPHLR